MISGGASRGRASCRLRKAWGALVLAAACAASGAALGAAAKKSTAAPELSAAQIVAKNVAARGGLEAWRKIETMVWTGHLQSTRAPEPSMPFQLEQKRPNKTRFEIHTMSEHTVRVFDGASGWKSHPDTSGRLTLQPYTPDEIRFARDERTVDGPLIDLEARGSQVALAGVEQLEGRKAYHLTVRLASGDREAVWVDAKTFLDVKVARMTYGPGGVPRMVPTVYRDFKNFEGLQIPTTIQIGDGSTGTPDLMQIERVVLNAPLNDRQFLPPGGMRRPAAGSLGARAATSAERESVAR